MPSTPVRTPGLLFGLFWALAVLSCLPWLTPPLCLLIGLVFAVVFGPARPTGVGRMQQRLLQVSVVGLGFGLNFAAMVKAGATGAGATAVSLVATLILGWWLARALKVDRVTGELIAAGTAICGGSAIAALGPVLGADERDMSVSLSVVFLLNAIALLVFPLVGHWLHLSPVDFGWWAAIAIHDTSAVAGAASRYAPEALAIAVPVKLARALWILPLVAFAAMQIRQQKVRPALPWFVLAFVAASLVATLLPSFATAWQLLVKGAKSGLNVTLFMVGTGLSREAMRNAGWRPFVQAIALWIVVAVVTLLAVRSFQS